MANKDDDDMQDLMSKVRSLHPPTVHTQPLRTREGSSSTILQKVG